MSDQSDSQNRSEEQIDMSKGTSPSSSTYEGSRSTPSNLPKARASTQLPENPDPKEPTVESKKRKERVKKTMARVVGQPSMMEEEATSKRVEPAQGTKPGLKIKRPAGR